MKILSTHRQTASKIARESPHSAPELLFTLPSLPAPPSFGVPVLGVGRGVLGNDANKVSPANSRQKRYALRDELATFTGLERVRKCGRCSRGPRVGLRVTDTTGAAGWSGLTTCGSVWACPVCSAKIGARRAREVSQICTNAAASGLYLSMVTLTMRHHKGQKLADLWDSLGYAWHRVVSGKNWRKAKEAAELEGIVRSVEVTHGASGWHVHIHALLLTHKPLDSAGLPSVMYERWASGLAAKGLESVKDSGGFDFSACAPGDEATMARYVAKMGQSPQALALETTLGAWKKARGKNRTPWQILADIPRFGDMDDLELWWEYEQASHGRRALTFSRGLREKFGLEAERTDEEIAAEDLGNKDFLTIDATDWKHVRPFAAYLLDLAESHGPHMVAAWLDAHAIPWQRGPD